MKLWACLKKEESDLNICFALFSFESTIENILSLFVSPFRNSFVYPTPHSLITSFSTLANQSPSVAVHVDQVRLRQDRLYSGFNLNNNFNNNNDGGGGVFNPSPLASFSSFRYMQPWLTQRPLQARGVKAHHHHSHNSHNHHLRANSITVGGPSFSMGGGASGVCSGGSLVGGSGGGGGGGSDVGVGGHGSSMISRPSGGGVGSGEGGGEEGGGSGTAAAAAVGSGGGGLGRRRGNSLFTSSGFKNRPRGSSSSGGGGVGVGGGVGSGGGSFGRGSRSSSLVLNGNQLVEALSQVVHVVHDVTLRWCCMYCFNKDKILFSIRSKMFCFTNLPRFLFLISMFCNTSGQPSFHRHLGQQ